MGEAPSPAPALWPWGYLDRCFARHRVCLSFGLWVCSSCCLLAAHVLLLYLRCVRRTGKDQSVLTAACFLLASLCDPAGSILAKQLTIQVFTGAYLAAVHLATFVFVLFPICRSKSTSSSGWGSQERRRGQQLQTSMFALVLPLSLGPGWTLWAAAPVASAPIRGPQRRLLGSLLQDNTETLGCLLGAISTLGSWASRFSPLSRTYQGEAVPSISLWTCLLSALAGLLYASAIVTHDQRPDYLLQATPWLLSSLGGAALDLSIIFVSWWVQCGMCEAWTGASEGRQSPDTQALLTSGADEEESPSVRSKNSDWVPLTTLPHCKSLQTMAAISHYMELTMEPVQRWDLEDLNPGRDRGSPMEMLRAQVLRSSMMQVDLNSDE